MRVWASLGMCCVLSLAGAGSAQAGAWTQEEGKGQAIAVGTYTDGDRYFDERGNLFSGQLYRKFELPVLVEYGFTEWFTGIVSPSYLRTSIGTPSNSDYSGLGYTEFGGRARLWRNDTSVFSVQATARIAGAPNDFNPAQVGNTDNEYDLRALFGHSFKIGDWPAFFDGQLAYRARAGGPADEVRLDLTLGVRPAPQWLLLAQSFNVFSAGSAYGVFTEGRYHKIQLSVAYEFAENWTAQLGGLMTVAGENALEERGVVAGIWYRF